MTGSSLGERGGEGVPGIERLRTRVPSLLVWDESRACTFQERVTTS
jgi:hypothetical protein